MKCIWGWKWMLYKREKGLVKEIQKVACSRDAQVGSLSKWQIVFKEQILRGWKLERHRCRHSLYPPKFPPSHLAVITALLVAMPAWNSCYHWSTSLSHPAHSNFTRCDGYNTSSPLGFAWVVFPVDTARAAAAAAVATVETLRRGKICSHI